jgi:hypothetical protein
LNRVPGRIIDSSFVERITPFAALTARSAVLNRGSLAVLPKPGVHARQGELQGHAELDPHLDDLGFFFARKWRIDPDVMRQAE